MPTVALVMIARNEARCIARCLNSVRTWVDRMVVLDTGSSDDTMAIARACGAEVHEAAWSDDFSAARNQALALGGCDWHLVLDADEWLISGGEALAALREQPPEFVGTLTVDGTADFVVTSGYLTLDSDKSYAVNATTTNALGATGSTGSTLKKVSDLDVTTFGKATDALKTVDSALAFISGERAKLGALQSRFETTVSNLQVTSENLSASRSRILDADFAAETAMLSKAQILQQAGTAMVAQANQLPQGVLALLR